MKFLVPALARDLRIWLKFPPKNCGSYVRGVSLCERIPARVTPITFFTFTWNPLRLTDGPFPFSLSLRPIFAYRIPLQSFLLQFASPLRTYARMYWLSASLGICSIGPPVFLFLLVCPGLAKNNKIRNPNKFAKFIEIANFAKNNKWWDNPIGPLCSPHPRFTEPWSSRSWPCERS